MTPFTEAELAPTLRPLLEAFQLPPRAFTDDAVAAWEAEHLFLGGWLCLGHAGALDGRGVFFVRDVAADSVLAVADDAGTVRAFHNVCRHRGTRLVDEPAGRLRRLQCPYHAWTYGFDGSLRNAPHTDRIVGFEASCHGLAPVRVDRLHGLLFADVSGAAAPLEDHAGALADHLARYRLGAPRPGAAPTSQPAAN